MLEITKVCKPCVVVTIDKQAPITVHTTKETELPIVEIQTPGLQGPASVERPLEEDPLQTYLKARGEFNANNS